MIDLGAVFERLSRRGIGGRTEADIQSDVKLLLLSGGLEVEDDDLEVRLESPAGAGRIDVEVGYTVIETKRDLRKARVSEEAIVQLAGYVAERAKSAGARYVGILTDGHDWRLYTLVHDGTLRKVATFELRGQADGASLLAWLSTVLATTTQVPANPIEIDRRFGAGSPAHELDMTALRELWSENEKDGELRLKMELWAKLLHTAFGEQFDGGADLFVRHTYLVITAELIAHEVLGIDVGAFSPAELVEGKAFRDAGVFGVVESDFFDWPAEVVGGDAVVRAIARRVSQVDWSTIEHDVLKHLYESVINAEQRHALGEYYTPDWLAEAVTEEVVDDPETQRIADFACGSGTFLFHAVRRVVAALEARGADNSSTLTGVTSRVVGVDVHPVAVTLARVTYLLALGSARLTGERSSISIPVYLGDSVQWQVTHSVLSEGGIAIPTSDGQDLFASELFFPASVMADPGVFERLVEAMVSRATKRERGARPFPKIAPLVAQFELSEADRASLQTTLELLCDLHDHHRNHIWGYYIRNLARPMWLTRAEGRVDRIVGNPPWLSYRFMDKRTQGMFKDRSNARNLWAGAQVSTQQDLSAYFLTRICELYLNPGGRFGVVMPRAVLDRKAATGFRSGQWGVAGAAKFEDAWDLDAVRPPIFPVPASVVVGRYVSHQPRQVAEPLTHATELWEGRVEHSRWQDVRRDLSRNAGSRNDLRERQSPYASVFTNGATVYPRVLFCVRSVRPPGALGTPAGITYVQSERSNLEKGVWKDLPSRGPVPIEAEFVRSMHLGSTLVPYRMLDPWQVVVPLEGETGRLIADDAIHADYQHLWTWWRDSAKYWSDLSGSSLSLRDQLDYLGKLEAQFPSPRLRVAYTKSGTRLAAALIEDRTAIVDHKLYWGAVASMKEARYLEAVLNAEVTQRMVEPLQSRGNIGARDFDMYPWHLPIPRFSEGEAAHAALAAAGDRAATIAATVDVAGCGFQVARRRVRAALDRDGVATEVEALVSGILVASQPR